MGLVILIGLMLLLVAVSLPALLRMQPERLAQVLRFGAAGAAGLVGAVMMFTGKAFLGMPVLTGAFILFRRAWQNYSNTRRPGQKSRVYSDALMMELDIDSGAMNGMVLKGSKNGSELNQLDDDALLELYIELDEWPESHALLETYLDRRIADWRDRVDAQSGAGLRTPPGTGAMTEQEAYEILGLPFGAGEPEIRQAHRRLMKRVHPDTGGSAPLASRLNSAKDFLLSRRHV